MPAEVNTTSAGTKAQALHRVMMGGNHILQNTIGVGNRMVGGTETTSVPTAGQQQGAGKGGIGWSARKEAVKFFEPAGITQEFLEKLLKW